jgi:hypothetical protein
MKTAHKNNRRRLFLSIFLVGSVIVPATSSARTQPASSGRAIAAADYGCFSLWYSSMTNNCGSAKSLEIPLVIDNSGNKTVTIAAYGASVSNNVCCTSSGLNRELTLVWGSGAARCLPSFGSSQLITTTGAYVPSWGYAYATCTVSPGGRVNTVGFNE